jgi:SAM-dependent methyltransferase
MADDVAIGGEAMPARQIADAANAEQADYWNGPRGEQWVSLQTELDQRLAPSLDPLLASAGIQPGHSVLDVGCGTGASLLAVSRLAGPTGRVLGIDIAAPLLACAARRLSEDARARVELVEADAQTHAFAPAGHDVIISRFGVMFFSDPVAAFANLRRALAPHGRLAFVCWTGIEDNPWFGMPLAAGIARLGPPEPAPPRAPGPLAFSEPDYVREILDAAGFAAVAIERRTIRLAGAASAEEEARLSRDVGPLARLIKERSPSPATVDAILQETAARFAGFATKQGMRIPACVWVVAARPEQR